MLLQKNAPKIPKFNITALTRIDVNRAKAYIHKNTEIDIRYLKNIIVWGNHSELVHPDLSQAYFINKDGTP
jgi:malate/lactate dehydrogenase